MIQDTVAKIKHKISSSRSIKETSKSDLLALVSALEHEVRELAKTHSEHAESITGFTEISAHEATRNVRNQRLLSVALDGLRSSVEGFEKSHPKLVESVNAICLMLSNSGI
jgi:hypothetical protein